MLDDISTAAFVIGWAIGVCLAMLD
jgi:hypothetical protein